MIAITPRSFCNGPYFRPFRAWLLREMRLRRLHVFDSRESAFNDDAVLQENVIIHAVKGGDRQIPVLVTSSDGPDDDLIVRREVAYSRIVRPDDPNLFIHIIPDELGQAAADRMGTLTASLADLGLTVSTGRVVDFRTAAFLRAMPGPDTVPLIYPTHITGGCVRWPKDGRKPNALLDVPATGDMLVPGGVYVVVKRFTAKEERRRIVAVTVDSARVAPGPIAFENHLNYYHESGAGLPPELAHGLASFLNSTLVDSYFRQFSGHTQVNATDLRSLRYPSRAALSRLGQLALGIPALHQDVIDRLVEREL